MDSTLALLLTLIVLGGPAIIVLVLPRLRPRRAKLDIAPWQDEGTKSEGAHGPDALGNRAAAAILRGLLAGELTPEQARARWPSEPVSPTAARSYIDYFDGGLDGRGMRDPSVDDVIDNLVRLLERGGLPRRSA
jgi:hypothetical protein